MRVSRRGYLGLVTVAVSGCMGGGKPMTVSDTRLAYEEGRIGVFVTLQDTNQNRAGPVIVTAELLDANDETVAKREEEIDMGGADEGNAVVWFDGISKHERERVEAARAVVTS